MDFCGRPAAFDARCSGPQANQALNGVTGSTFGARLQPATEQHKHNDYSCRLEINAVRAWRQSLRREGRYGRKAVGGQGAEGHKRVHIRCGPDQSRNSMNEKAEAGDEQNEGGERKLQKSTLLQAYGFGNELVNAGDEMPAHLQGKHWQGQQSGKKCESTEACAFLRSKVLGFEIRVLSACAISEFRHRLRQRCRRGRSVEEAYFGRSCGQVHRGFKNAWMRCQCALNPACTGGALHVRDTERGLGCPGGISRTLQGRDGRMDCSVVVVFELG